MSKYFVWANNNGNLYPQIIHDELPVDGSGKIRVSLHFSKRLDAAEEKLDLDHLAKIYEDKKNGAAP